MKKELESTVSEFNNLAMDLIVNDDDSFIAAGAKLKESKQIENNINEFFDPNIKRIHTAHKEAIAQKKVFLTPITDGTALLKNKVLVYQAKKDEEAKAEQIRLDKIARDEADALKIKEAEALKDEGREAEAESKLEEETFVAPSVVESAPKVEGVSYRDNWKMEIIDASLVPREWLIPDEKGLKSFSKSMKGRTKVPGVRFYNDKTTVIK